MKTLKKITKQTGLIQLSEHQNSRHFCFCLPITIGNKLKLALPFCLTFLIIFSSFTKVEAQRSKKYTWETIFVSIPEFKNIIINPDSFRLQIIYTQVNNKKKNKIDLDTYKWSENSGNYFYPASTVKLPIACLTLEKMNKTGVKLDDYIVFDTNQICDNYHYRSYDRTFYRVNEGQTLKEIATEFKKTVEDIVSINMFIEPLFLQMDGLLNICRQKSEKHEFGYDLSNMLIFSDNNIFNHMYDYLGHEKINARLKELSYSNSCINRRLLYCDSIQNKKTLGFNVYCSNDSLLYSEEEKISGRNLCKNENSTIIGVSHYDSEGLKDDPKDFSYHNRMELEDLHKMLTTIVYPQNFSKEECFKIDENSRYFLLKSMALYPDEVEFQNDNNYGYREEGFTKYLFVGNNKKKIPSNIRIFNIVGLAYGFVTDCAYIVDLENNIEFFLSFTIYVNSNDILGDSRYEYSEIAFPFAQKIGQLIYEYELNRKRKRPADLNQIKKILEIN